MAVSFTGIGLKSGVEVAEVHIFTSKLHFVLRFLFRRPVF